MFAYHCTLLKKKKGTLWGMNGRYKDILRTLIETQQTFWELDNLCRVQVSSRATNSDTDCTEKKR